MWKQKIWSSNRELGGVDTEGLCPDLLGPSLPFLVPHFQLLCSFDFKGQWCSHWKPSSLPLHSGKLLDVISLPGLLCGIMLRLLTWSKSHLGLPSFPSLYCSPVPFYYFYYRGFFPFRVLCTLYKCISQPLFNSLEKFREKPSRMNLNTLIRKQGNKLILKPGTFIRQPPTFTMLLLRKIT